MEFKGAKGNWILQDKVKKNEHAVKYMTIDFSRGEINCVAVYDGIYNNSLYLKANALLISKAPEMLEMIKKLIKNMPLGACIEETQEAKQLIHEATNL